MGISDRAGLTFRSKSCPSNRLIRLSRSRISLLSCIVQFTQGAFCFRQRHCLSRPLQASNAMFNHAAEIRWDDASQQMFISGSMLLGIVCAACYFHPHLFILRCPMNRCRDIWRIMLMAQFDLVRKILQACTSLPLRASVHFNSKIACCVIRLV